MPNITKRLLPDVLRAQLVGEDNILDYRWHRFFSDLIEGLPVMRSTSITFNPSSIAANTTSQQNVTFNDVTTNDLVMVNKPTHTTGLTVTSFVVSDDTVGIIFTNNTGSAIDPPSEVYKLYAITL